MPVDHACTTTIGSYTLPRPTVIQAIHYKIWVPAGDYPITAELLAGGLVGKTEVELTGRIITEAIAGRIRAGTLSAPTEADLGSEVRHILNSSGQAIAERLAQGGGVTPYDFPDYTAECVELRLPGRMRAIAYVLVRRGMHELTGQAELTTRGHLPPYTPREVLIAKVNQARARAEACREDLERLAGQLANRIDRAMQEVKAGNLPPDGGIVKELGSRVDIESTRLTAALEEFERLAMLLEHYGPALEPVEPTRPV